MAGDYTETSPLIAPTITRTSEIDLEAARPDQIQCRICLETEGRNFIAPCKCKGTSKYVHRECLDHWRSVKEGFAFAHCTTCRAPYYLRVNAPAYRKWRILKFRFFVTRDIIFIFLVVQMVIALLSYLVYLIDGYQKYWLRLTCGFGSVIGFYYICGAILFFALMCFSGCFITCYDSSICNDTTQSCNELCCCCIGPTRSSFGYSSYYYNSSATNCCICSDSTTCCDSSACSSCDCNCQDSSGENGLHVLFIIALIILLLFAVIGIFYSVLVATMVGQRIWQRHYHILTKRMLTKEYVVESVDEEVNGPHWYPPPLPPEHFQELEKLGLT